MADVPSTKPYLIRALHEWCTDAGFTPHLAVVVGPGVRVPAEHVRSGEIVLNVSSQATHRLRIGNDAIEFQARFGGVAREIYIPLSAIRAIYARENGLGMAFDASEGEVEAPAGPAPAEPASSGPRLAIDRTVPVVPKAEPPPEETGEKPPDPPRPKPKDRPRLTRIK